MAQVRLLSIKRNPEHSYFYENEGATFDSNSNEVIATTEKDEKKVSKKVRKASEKKEKKQKHELKKREKEKNQGNNPTGIETNKNELSNGNVHDSHFDNAAFHVERDDNTEDTNVKGEISPTSANLDCAPEPNNENAQSAEPNEGGPSNHHTNTVEETITIQGANQSEEAPPEQSWHFKPSPQVTEMEQGQHVEVEISEVTELDDMPEEANGQVVLVSNASGPESPILAATVQEVESGMDLKSFFMETYGEPGVDVTEDKRRKSVRFEEPDEIDHDRDSETHVTDKPDEDAEKITEDTESHVRLQPVEEIVSKEQTSNVESCEVNWEDIFESCEKEGTNVGNEPQSEVVNHRGEVVSDDIITTGKHASDDVTPIEKRNERREDATRKKDKRKKGGLLKWCFS